MTGAAKRSPTMRMSGPVIWMTKVRVRVRGWVRVRVRVRVVSSATERLRYAT